MTAEEFSVPNRLKEWEEAYDFLITFQDRIDSFETDTERIEYLEKIEKILNKEPNNLYMDQYFRYLDLLKAKRNYKSGLFLSDKLTFGYDEQLILQFIELLKPIEQVACLKFIINKLKIKIMKLENDIEYHSNGNLPFYKYSEDFLKLLDEAEGFHYPSIITEVKEENNTTGITSTAYKEGRILSFPGISEEFKANVLNNVNEYMNERLKQYKIILPILEIHLENLHLREITSANQCISAEEPAKKASSLRKNTKIIWLKSEHQLRELFKKWIALKYVNNTSNIEPYLANFVDSDGTPFSSKAHDKIIWIGTQAELTTNIVCLINSGFISKANHWKRTSEVFKKLDGEFDALSLTSANVQAKPKKTHQIEEIVKYLTKIS